MNNQISENTIQDVVGLPIFVSHCTYRVKHDCISAFSPVGTPHILRFRRVFNNLTDLNGNYDIYIDCDFKLLLYNDDCPGFTTVTDNSGNLVNIPVYNFTDNAPYILPAKQPAPFHSISSKEAQIIKEIHELLDGSEKISSVSDSRINDNNAEPQSTPASENTESVNNDNNHDEGELITVKDIDTGDNSANDDYAKPQPIPNRKNTDSDAYSSFIKMGEVVSNELRIASSKYP